LVKAQAVAEIAKADKLLDHVTRAEGRAERLYIAAEEILTRALADDNPKTALQAIRTAIDDDGTGRHHRRREPYLTPLRFEQRHPVPAMAHGANTR
jgi:hypothetical protein